MIPAEKSEAFRVVDIGLGGGWLSEAILDYFPRAEVIPLDGSPSMIQYTRARLTHFSDRLQFQPFNLFDERWQESLEDIRCFVRSLVVHHLNGEEKNFLKRIKASEP